MLAWANAPNFRLALARVIVPTSGPGAALATLEDAARSVGLPTVLATGATALGFCSRVASAGRRDRKKERR
jgi:hypothetical protein